MASDEVTVAANGALGIGTISIAKLSQDGIELILDGGASA